jgi:hypothetical protein
MVIGASSGTGTGSVVDATTVLATGDLKVRYATGTLSGFVRANGRTIGSESSGATERANADCEELFIHLWTEDANLSVSTGRGATAAADWAANKTIALPDWRGRALAALDDMGNSAAGRLTSTYFGTSAIALGAAGGNEATTLTAILIPTLTSTGANAISVSSTVSTLASGFNSGSNLTNSGNQYGAGSAAPVTIGAITSTGSNSISVSSSGTGGASTNINNATPMMLATVYMKL